MDTAIGPARLMYLRICKKDKGIVTFFLIVLFILLPRWDKFQTINWVELLEFSQVSMFQIQKLLESNIAN